MFKKFFLFLALLDLCCCSGFPLVLSSGGYSLVAALGFPSRWLPFLQSTGSRARGLQQLWLQALEPGSVVAARGLRCSAARGVFPDQELNVLAGGLNTLTGACLLHWQVDSSPLSQQGSPLLLFLIDSFFLKM